MARPTTISDDEILAAARAVFGEKGVRGTTAEVAARAGISEGIIFKRFGTKAQLFRQAMDAGADVEGILQILLDLGPLETAADFERLVAWTLETLRRVVPMVLMSWAESRTESGLPKHIFATEKPPPLRALIAVTKYFERQFARGGMKKRNPEIVARILIGSVWHFAFMEVALGSRNTALAPAKFVKELARMLHSDLSRTGKGKKAP
jgi:AcrR family transcriptional regulator